MKMKVSKEQFQEYRQVQSSGMFNMFDPQAREMTSLDRDEWIYILKNYAELKAEYEGGK